MKIMIIGAQGNLGMFLTFHLQTSHQVIPMSRFNADFGKLDQVQALYQKFPADLIINTVAINQEYSRVKEIDIWHSNAVIPATLAALCQDKMIPFIHFSCLDINGNDDIIAKSKLQGELLAQKIYPQTQIIRLERNYNLETIKDLLPIK